MKKPFVLIVEDDSWLADSFKLVLNQAGWRVERAQAAQEAIDAIDNAPPQVILLDILLPEANAFALLHELQSYGDTYFIPVVLCTTIPKQQMDQKALKNYGVVAVLDKTTLTPHDLVKTLQGAVDGANSH